MAKKGPSKEQEKLIKAKTKASWVGFNEISNDEQFTILSNRSKAKTIKPTRGKSK